MLTRYLKKEGGILNLLYRLKSHLSKQRKKQYSLLLILMICLAFAETISLASIIPFVGIFLDPETFFSHPWSAIFIDFFGITNNEKILLLITIIFIFLASVSGLIKILFIHSSNAITGLTEADFKSMIFKYNISQAYDYHLRQNSNLVMSNLIQKTLHVSTILTYVSHILSAVMIIFLVVIFLIYINSKVTLSIALIIITFFTIIALIKKRRFLINSQQISESQNRIVNIFQDSVGYVSDIIIYSLQNIFISNFDKAAYRIAENYRYNRNVGETPRIYLECIALISLAILIFIFGSNKSEIATNLTFLAALGLAAQKILPLFYRVFNHYSQIRTNQFILKDILDLLDRSKKENAIVNFSKKLDFKKSIKLNNVYFSYNKDNRWILKNINLEIKKGSMVGIKGSTGSGKSTLGNLIIGLLDPTEGQIFVDDILINSQNKISWQKNFSIIPQKIFLHDVSIAENIAIGIEPNKINLEKVKSAAKQARISDFIESTPKQYDEKVGERGIKLSGGQQQRIGIARALYRNSEVILCDEATNQLDTDTESLVMQSINELDKETTIIFIAHRLSTLEKCDEVIDLTKF